ncbi:MAG: phosphonate C-P lyase system protein PhnG [Pikeienuella sp.]
MAESSLDRETWMSLLAKAESDRLCALWASAGLSAAFDWVRMPETGLVMVRGRAGGTGAPFNLGEMTVTRASLRLESGEVGHAYVAGRSKRKAEIAALCDALLQVPARADDVRERVIRPLAEAAEAAARERAEKAGATKVEFFTLTRGGS